MISRDHYINQLVDFKDKQIIKVVTGVRRCGKSTLFLLYQNYLKSIGVNEKQIISINLEDLDYEYLLDYKELYKYIKSRILENSNTYVFIDEIQNCESFEKVVDSLFIKDGVDVYITGSNAYMLSGELATYLSGRYVKIDMLPLSFKEFYLAGSENFENSRQCFNSYIRQGAFPYIVSNIINTSSIDIYLDGIYNTVLMKDVVQRNDVKDVLLLKQIIKTLASSIGSPISSNKIRNTIVSNGRKVSVNTIENYIKALCDGYIFYKVDRFDVKGRQNLKTLGKYYIVDMGIRNLIVTSKSGDLGHVIENIVYLELIRRGYKVNIGKVGDAEVDFIATGMNKTVYIQVSATVLHEKTLNRELKSLKDIDDNHEKILLTLDEIGSNSNHNGIIQKNLLEWLVE